MTYSREYYQKNKDKFYKWSKEYCEKNHDRVIENRRKYDKENRDKINETKRKWRLGKGKVKYEIQYKKDGKKYWQKIKNSEVHQMKRKQQRIKYYQKNREKIRAYGKKHDQIPAVKARRRELERIRRRLNPRSNRRGSIDLQIAMNNVRKRDHNTCQWQGCKLTFRQTPIHVHHIFPKSEYPDFELIEQYMICYCANHHGLWHRMRGDKYSEMIPARYQEKQFLTIEGRN